MWYHTGAEYSGGCGYILQLFTLQYSTAAETGQINCMFLILFFLPSFMSIDEFVFLLCFPP